MPALAHRDGAAARHRRRHGRLRAELRRVAPSADGASRAVPEPARQRLVRHRRRNGDEHSAAQSRRGRRRDRRDDRGPGDRRRAAVAAHQGPGLSDRRLDRRPRWHPRRVPLGPRPDLRPRARAHRAASRRQERDHHHRAAVRRSQGRRGRRDREDRRPRQGRNADRGADVGRRAPGPLRQGGHAHLRRAEARGGAAGRAEQDLQADAAADDVRLQRGRARRRRPEDALAARADPSLPRLPARGRHPPLEVRAAPGGEARARPRGLPEGARLRSMR